MAEIVYRSRGYETFKETISEEIGQREKSLGIGQETLSTIEIGLSPFIPFSQHYKMESRKLPSNGWGVGAEHGPEDKDWDEGPIEEARQSLTRNLDKAPGDQMKEAAENLARTISNLLYDEGITRDANTPVMEEIQHNALAMMVTERWPRKWKDKSADIGTIERINDDQLEALGGETFDLYAKNEASTKALEMSLNMLHRQTGDASFIEGVRALESTTMMGEKWFQQHTPKMTTDIAASEKALETAANKEVQDALDEFGALTDGILAAHKATEGAKATGGKETQAYFARQMFSRLYEFQAQLGKGDTGKNLGNAYMFTYPIDKWHAAYIRIQPFFKGPAGKKELKKVTVKARIIGGSTFEALAKGKTWDKNDPTKAAVFFQSSKTTYAAHTQILIMDLIAQGNFTLKEQLEMTTKMSQIAADQEVLKSGRTEMLGVGLENEFATTLGNITNASFAVDGAELLGKKDAVDMLHNQVKFILGQAKGKIEPELANFYGEAMEESNKISDNWIDDVDAVRVSDKPQGPYARAARGEKGLYRTQKMMEGIGIPFWFTIGRDPNGYKKFKLRQSHEAIKGTIKYEQTGIDLKAANPYSEPLSTLGLGTQRVIRGPKGGIDDYPQPMNRDWGSSAWQESQNQPKMKGGVEPDYGFYKGGKQLAHNPIHKIIKGTGGWDRSVHLTEAPDKIAADRLSQTREPGVRTLREIMESDRTHHSYGQPRDPSTGQYV